jgi:hypothetical protein
MFPEKHLLIYLLNLQLQIFIKERTSVWLIELGLVLIHCLFKIVVLITSHMKWEKE